jgi:RNA polymerase sigma factor for flagellar operon FliA
MVDPMTHSQQALVLENLPLVKHIAGKLPRGVRIAHWDDLISEGTAGLCEAALRYDPDRGTAFSTFAYRRISGSMRDYIRREKGLSNSARSRIHDIITCMSEEYKDSGEIPSVGELSRKLGLSREAILRSMEQYTQWRVVSLDREMRAAGSENDSVSIDQGLTSSDDTLDRHTTERLEEVDDAVRSDCLTMEERQVIFHRYYEGMTYKDIAAKLRYSLKQVVDLHRSALERLHEVLAEEGGET